MTNCNGTALVAAVAAERQEQAEDGVRAIKFTFDTMEHFVDEDDLKGAEAAKRTKDLGNNTKGDVEAALKSAAVVHKGQYGIATISHMCLETHGSCTRWEEGKLIVNHSTQNVSGTPANFVSELQKQHNISVDAADVTVLCQFVGGGFGSKFAADDWGVAAAKMSKETGRPVRLMLDRATELKIAGTRPSGFAEVTIAADKDGKIVAWDSHHWGTNGGMKGGTINLAVPVCFRFRQSQPQGDWPGDKRRPRPSVACSAAPAALCVDRHGDRRHRG